MTLPQKCVQWHSCQSIRQCHWKCPRYTALSKKVSGTPILHNLPPPLHALNLAANQRCELNMRIVIDTHLWKSRCVWLFFKRTFSDHRESDSEFCFREEQASGLSSKAQAFPSSQVISLEIEESSLPKGCIMHSPASLLLPSKDPADWLRPRGFQLEWSQKGLQNRTWSCETHIFYVFEQVTS